jgi:hypothetical protein
MEKHENREAKGRRASFDRVAGGFLRVSSLQDSNSGLWYKRTQSADACLAVEIPHHSSIPSFHWPPSPTGAGCTNEPNRGEVSRQTKPIRDGRRVVQTKPICPGRAAKTIAGDKCVKRSQSADGCSVVEIPHYSSIPSFHRPLRLPGAGCTNEPNLRGARG